MNEYLFSKNIINIGEENTVFNDTTENKFCFSLLAGNLVLNNDNYTVKSINILNNENVDFGKKSVEDFSNIKFENIEYHENFYNSFNKNVNKLCVGSIFQSMVYFMYNVTETYDFYNHPELIEENGFVSNSNLRSFNIIEQIIQEATTNIIKDQNIFNSCQRLESSEKKNQNFVNDDVVWIKYGYELKLLENSKIIYFLIGWKIKYNISNDIVLGNIYLNNEYQIEVYNDLKKEKIYSHFSTKQGFFELKIDNLNSYDYLFLIATSTNKNVTEYTYKNIIEIGKKSKYDTNVITTLAFTLHDELDNVIDLQKFYEYQEAILSKFNYSSIEDLYKMLDIYIYYTIAYISNYNKISLLLASFIYKQKSIIDLRMINSIKSFIEFIETENGLINNKEIVINSIWNSLQITNKTDQQTFATLKNIKKENRIYTSSYIFDYGLDFVQKNTMNINYPTDFIISGTNSNILKLIKNDFSIKWNNTIPTSFNSNSIQFILNSTEFVNITCNSKRAKRYSWINENDHSMNTLLKGLFGEMLSKTRIVPVEKTINNLAENGNEPYNDYITTKSLARSLIQSPETYFIEQHNEAILQLQMYYQNLWNTDNNALYDLLESNTELKSGDIIAIPINISMKYKIYNPWSTTLDNQEQRSVEGKWAFIYNFIIQ